MKPLKLRLAGLHSFREIQEVDFESLCEAGLFGIFGPTGSGKSTILDAITLALYGHIDRAAWGTQGILNHAEDRVLVEFTFELAHPAGSRRYRVERVYRRSGESTVKSTGSRLVEITARGEIPLAEKSRVNSKIEEIIGLDRDEFTRAVVLPQGKFADFIKLEPAKRRNMLQNLFGLHEYGFKLMEQVKGRLQDVNTLLTGIKGELEGLGDASDSAVEQSRSQLESAKKQVEEAGARWTAMDEKVKKLEQAWEWQEELTGVEAELGELLEMQPEIDRYAGILDAASRAAKAMPFLQEADRAEANHDQVKVRLSAAREGARLACEKAGFARLAIMKAEARRKEEEPALIERKPCLERAMGLEKEVASLKDEGEKQAGVLKSLEKERAEVVSDLEACRRDRKLLEQSISSCRDQLIAVQVSFERRRRAIAAATAWHGWLKALQVREQAEAAEGEKAKALVLSRKSAEVAASALQTAGENLLAAEAGEKEARESCPDEQGVLHSLLIDLEKFRHQVKKVIETDNDLVRLANTLAGLMEQLDTAQKYIRKAEEEVIEGELRLKAAGQQVVIAESRLEDMQKSNLASSLVVLLREGEPCLVCGSRQHPAPAQAGGTVTLAEARDELTLARQVEKLARDKLEQARRDVALSEAGVSNLTEKQGQALAELEQKRMDLELARSMLPASWSGLEAAEIRVELDLAGEELTRRQAAYNSWGELFEENQKSREKAQKAFNAASLLNATASESLKSAIATHREAGERLAAAVEEERQRQADLNVARGELPVAQIEQEQSQLECWDRERTDLEEKRDMLDAGLKENSRKLEELAGRENTLVVSVSKEREKLNALREQYKQKDAEWKDITGGKAAGELLALNEKLLKEMRAAEEQSRLSFDEAERERERLEQVAAAGEESFTLAEQRLEDSRRNLAATLAELNFATRNEVESDILGQEEAGRLAGEVDAHKKETQRLSSARQSLLKKLGGRTLSAAEREAWLDSQAAAKKDYDNSLQKQGAAVASFEKISADNARWNDLERRCNEQGVLKGQLEALEKLFRGNAFVEYLASEQLVKVALDASARLGQLTRYRYALEVDSEGGFVVRDDGNGGVKRPVSSLSGGETFITSLALALALSAQIQLKGQYPLEFFFLDEGFGTLDPDLLEVVLSTLEQLRLEHLTIGLISHVPELKNRLSRRLLVLPALQSGAGSKVILDLA